VDWMVKYLLPRKFHLVCGTSIGGIIALLLGLEIPLSKIKQMFLEKKEKIFPQKSKIIGAIKGTWAGTAAYGDEGLRELFIELTKDKYPDPDKLTLSHLKFPCAVTSYDLNVNSVVYFTNLTAECQNILIIDAILSTSAAPTYFPIHTFVCDDYEYQCVDGGIWGNDPRLFAFAFQRIFSRVRLTNIISFGTGLHQENYKNRKNQEDVASWLKKGFLISTIMNASTSQVEKIFEFAFKTGLIRHTKLNITLKEEIDLADSNSLPETQTNCFEKEKNDVNNKERTLTKFAENMTKALELTWRMGCTIAEEDKTTTFQPKKIYDLPINLNPGNREKGVRSK